MIRNAAAHPSRRDRNTGPRLLLTSQATLAPIMQARSCSTDRRSRTGFGTVVSSLHGRLGPYSARSGRPPPSHDLEPKHWVLPAARGAVEKQAPPTTRSRSPAVPGHRCSILLDAIVGT